VSDARPITLAEANWRAVSRARFEVAVLPWGATEAHNFHLPYATDTIQAAAIAGAAAARATEAGAHVIVLPTLPFGVQTGQRDVPFCINMNPTTQLAVLRDVIRSLEPHGVRKLLVLNGHGGNDFRWMIRELQPQVVPFLCTMNWYACVDPVHWFDEPGDHAGEMETSVMLHLAPSLVRPLREAGPGTAKRFRPGALRDGTAWAQRAWTQVTADTGVGNPAAATAARGAAFFDAVVEHIARFITELDGADPDALYE
jgi:creatinine amidohydrolase